MRIDHTFMVKGLTAGKAIVDFSGKAGFLAPDYPCPIEWDGINFPSLSHAWVYARLRTYGVLKVNRAKRKFMLELDGVQDVRRWSEYNKLDHAGLHATVRRCHVSDDLDLGALSEWGREGKHVLKVLVGKKFSDAGLAQKLARTGDRVLIYGNCGEDRRLGAVVIGNSYLGENLLGHALMRLRRKIDV